MPVARSFEDLAVWQKAHQLVLAVYRVTRSFPREELFGLTSQVRRSAASVPANIAEGFRKSGKADKARYYNMALASLDETRYHLLLAHDLGYADTRSLRADGDEVARMLDSYARLIVASERNRRRGFGFSCLLISAVGSIFWLLASGF